MSASWLGWPAPSQQDVAGCDGAPTCVVCHEALHEQPTVRLMGCGHEYHAMCAAHALQHTRGACPLCRYVPGRDDGAASEEGSERDAGDGGDRSEDDEARRRTRALLSTLGRVRHGSADAHAVLTVRLYRALKSDLRDAVRRRTELRREWRARNREVHAQVRKMAREQRWYERKWDVIDYRIGLLQMRRAAVLADMLARYEGDVQL